MLNFLHVVVGSCQNDLSEYQTFSFQYRTKALVHYRHAYVSVLYIITSLIDIYSSSALCSTLFCEKCIDEFLVAVLYQTSWLVLVDS